MECKKDPHQKKKKERKKKKEISSSASSYKGEFAGANRHRQFNYLEISLVYEKSDAHKTIYDSYDIELHQL